MTRASHGHRATVVAAVVLLAAAAAVGAARTKNECHSGDKAALLAIKSAFGNASYFQSWTSEYPCCDWIYVFCDLSASPYTARRVVAVSFLRDASLVGPLPGAAIARLTALQELNAIHVPGVNGTIPRDLSRLPNLNSIDISYTGVSGPVPAFLSKLVELTYLRLSFNALAGPIPASLGDIPNLSFLDLGRNRLTGAIPPLLLSKTRDTAYLSLSHNGLSGGVPAEFAAVKFWSLDLSRNGLAGDASFLFGVNKSLETLNLSRNAFSFNLSAVELPSQLGDLDISHNEIYGVLPPQVANLEYLNVSYNRLSGVVPSGGNMGTFDQYCFQHNKGLCGTPLPPCK
jgi:Leucine-rich repeat (LRR) protein